MTSTRRARTLGTSELAEFRRMLEQQQQFRTEQLEQLRAVDGRGGPLGSADDEISASLAAGATAALHDVRAALRRMDEGRYGTCVDCRAPLPRERLEILPQVATCMSCRRVSGVLRRG